LIDDASIVLVVGTQPSEAEIHAAWSSADHPLAVTRLLESYGDELLQFLVAMTRDEADGNEGFSVLCEDLWKGIARFRGECSFRTWSYLLARHALGKLRRDPHRRRARPLPDGELAALVDRVRTQTASFLRTENRDLVATLRAGLDPDDQALLILRVGRGLAWKEIARVIGETAEPDDEELVRRAAALRKRFERVKAELKQRVADARDR
jgi:RNA polymerase sigma-70 factor, ECF subfamily